MVPARRVGPDTPEIGPRGGTGGRVHRFVVGTGRCGSTLLSRMLAAHRGVLSIFEFFNGIDAARRFDPAPIDGAEFASLISAEQPFVTAVLRRGYEVPEIVYPFGPGARYRAPEPENRRGQVCRAAGAAPVCSKP